MESLNPEDRNIVKIQQSNLMNGNECSGICIFKYSCLNTKGIVNLQLTYCSENWRLEYQISWRHFETTSPILINISDTLELLLVHVGRILSASYWSSSQPMLIVVRMMDNLHAALIFWKISTIMEHWTRNTGISWIR